MALDKLIKIDGGGISTTSDYRVGVITATKFVGPIEGSITATDATFSGNVSIAGTLTYEDVTNIDSVGIITAQSDIHVGAGVSAVGVGTFGSLDISGDIDVDGHTNLDNVSIAGVTTFSDDVKFTGNNYNVLWDKSDNSLKFDALAKIKLNDSFQFYHNTNGVLHNTSGTTYLYGSGSGNISIQAQVGAQNISCGPNSNTSLYYAGGQKLYTVSDGVYINDNLGIQDSIQHILDTNTKIRFPANDTVTIETAGGERLRINSTGITTFTENVFLSKDLDVDGHTNLDNVSVAGITTFNNNVHLLDNDYIRFGSSQDLSIFHDGTYNWFWSGGGHPTIHESSGSWTLRSVANQNYIIATENNSVDLYYSGTKRFETTSTGASVTGNFGASGNISLSGSFIMPDSLLHANDNTTRIRFPGPGTFSVDTSGNERLRIASNGRIGIGTDTDLTATVSLHGFTNPNAVTIKFSNTNSSDGFIQYFNGAMYIKSAATTGDKLMQFQTAGSARLTIDGNGHIATQNLASYSFNNDTANAKVFEVTGDGTVGEYGVINISGNQNANNGSVGNIRFVNRENSASNSGGSANSKAVASIQVYTVTSDSNAGDDCGGYMQFITKPEGGGGTGRMIITSGGDVLIADSTNSVYNDSSGGGMNLKASGQIVTKKEATSTADPLVWLNDTGQTTNKFIVFAQDGTEKASIGLAGNDLRFARDGYNETVRIDSSGRLLVGTTQTASKLTVDTDFCVIRGSSDPTINLLLGTTSSITKLYRILIDDSDNDKLQIRDNDTARITMDGSGNLGINNTNPQEKLQIAGNISLGNRGDNTSRYIGKGTDGNGGVIGGASANANSSWIGFISGSGTGQEDQIRFATHKSGVSGGERMRIDGEGIVKIKEKLVILNGGGFSETAPQGLSIRNAGIYLEQGNDITWNNGDNSISGESGYHLSFKTYNGSSNTEKLQISGGSGNAGNWLKTSQAGALFAYDVKSNNSSTCRPAAGDWVYVGSFGYGSNKHGKFVVEWSNISSPGCCHHGYVMLEGGTSYGAGYDYDWSESLKVLHYDAHNSDHFKAWKMVDDGNVLKVFGQWNGGSVASGTFYVTALTGDTYLGDCFYPATPVVDNNSYDGTRLTIDGTFQQGGSGLNPSTKRMQGGSYYGLLHTYGGLDTYGTLSTRGTGAGNGYFGTIWCNYGGISGSGKQAGSFTPYAGQVCPAGSGHQYIHVKFNITGGSMWMMEIMGYEYNGSWTSTVNGVSVTGDKIHHSISGGYHYNNNALFNGKAKAYRGITPGWYISGGYICCYIDTNNTGTSNRHGFYKFAGGVDWIIGRTQQKPTNIIAYSYSTGTSDQF